MKTKINKLTGKFNSFLLKLSVELQNLTFKKLFIITLFIVSILFIIHTLGSVAHAVSVDSGIGKIDAFDQLTTANGKWLSSKYRNNYYLDIQGLGMTDFFEKGTNGIANIIFSSMCMLAYICISAFYFCFDTNISDLFKNIIDNMQGSLKAGIFDNVFIFAFLFIGIYLVQQILKRNTVEIFSQMFKLTFIIVLAFLLTTETSAVITNSTEIAKSIGAQAVVAINNSDSTQNYAADVSGNLWFTLVHEPWLMMEANNKLTADQQDKILSLDPSSSDRQKYINTLNSQDNTIFGKEIGIDRIPQAFFILLLTFLKAGIILLIALVQIAFQVMAILCILLSMVALLLAMVPQLGGMTIIENLAKRIFETQLGIVVTTFMLALMTKMDSLIMIDFAKATNCGWLIALIIQTSIYVSMIIFRKKIFNLINVVAKNARAGHLVPRNFVNNKSGQFAEKTANAMAGAPGATVHVIRKAGRTVGQIFSSSSETGDGSSSSSKSNNGNSSNNSSTRSNKSEPNSKNNTNSTGTKVRGKNLKNNLENNKTNSGNENSNSNPKQSTNSNSKNGSDIKINDGSGNKLRNNASKNNGSNKGNVKGTTDSENSKIRGGNTSSGTDSTAQKQGQEPKENRPNLGSNLKRKPVSSNGNNVNSSTQRVPNSNNAPDSAKNTLRQNAPQSSDSSSKLKDNSSSKAPRISNSTAASNTKGNVDKKPPESTYKDDSKNNLRSKDNANSSVETKNNTPRSTTASPSQNTVTRESSSGKNDKSNVKADKPKVNFKVKKAEQSKNGAKSKAAPENKGRTLSRSNKSNGV